MALFSPAPCSESIVGNSCYVFIKIPDQNYTPTQYSGGIELHAKEITMGNVEACVHEGAKRIHGNHGYTNTRLV